MTTSERRFEELAAEALDGLPEWVREAMDNVEVVVEDRPPDGEPTLLGLYEGLPLTERGDYAGVLPDRITLFREPLERLARGDDAELRRAISETIVHEIAHHFGIDDERLRDLDAY
jgi:predicted Zn-dependent protease with MMP-like domain